jgi:hypothetical protein
VAQEIVETTQRETRLVVVQLGCEAVVHFGREHLVHLRPQLDTPGISPQMLVLALVTAARPPA